MSILGVRWSSLRRARSKTNNWFRLQSSKHTSGSLQAASSELTKYPHLAPTRLPEQWWPALPEKSHPAVGRLCNGVANAPSPLARRRRCCDWSTNGVRKRHIAGLTQKRRSGLPTWFAYTMFKHYIETDLTAQWRRNITDWTYISNPLSNFRRILSHRTINVYICFIFVGFK